MKIIVDSQGREYVDLSLKNYINNIFLTYDVLIPNDKAVLFAKNSTVNKLITDYSGTGIHRVIKKEKAEYVVVNRIFMSNYPQYFDGTNVTDDSTKEVVFGIYNLSMEERDTIKLILDFYNNNQAVVYVNQDKLNDSLNNGFIIDRETYGTIKELVNSPHTDNHILAVNMLVESKLEHNWEWILYLFHGKGNLLNYDKKGILANYFRTLNLQYSLSSLLGNLDASLAVVSNKDVIEGFEHLVREKFNKNIENFIRSTIGTNKFVLEDFKLKLKND